MNGFQTQDDSFWLWIRLRWKRVAAIASTFVVPIPAAAIFRFLSERADYLAPYARISPLILNLITIVVVLFFFLEQAPTDKDFPQESRAVENFAHWWHRVWWMWFLMYLVFTLLHFPAFTGIDGVSKIGFLDHVKDLKQGVPSSTWFLANTVTNAISFAVNACIVMCYLTLALYRNPRKRLAGVVAAIFIILFIPQIVVLGLSFAGQLDVAAFGKATLFMSLFYGTTGCIAITILVGRLESRVIGPPLMIVVLLYLYASLQVPLNVLHSMTDMPNMDAAVVNLADSGVAAGLILAAMLKALLFIFVYWLLHSGVLMFYMNWMTGANALDVGIDAQRRGFVHRFLLMRGEKIE